MVDNLIVLLPLLYVASSSGLTAALWLPASLLFLGCPWLGATMGLSASYASNREKASRRYSEALAVAGFGLAMLTALLTWTSSHPSAWWLIWALVYMLALGTFFIGMVLREIEVT